MVFITIDIKSDLEEVFWFEIGKVLELLVVDFDVLGVWLVDFFSLGGSSTHQDITNKLIQNKMKSRTYRHTDHKGSPAPLKYPQFLACYF